MDEERGDTKANAETIMVACCLLASLRSIWRRGLTAHLRDWLQFFGFSGSLGPSQVTFNCCQYLNRSGGSWESAYQSRVLHLLLLRIRAIVADTSAFYVRLRLLILHILYRADIGG